MSLRIMLFAGIFFSFFHNCISQQNKTSIKREFIINLTDNLCKNTLNSDTLVIMQEMIWLAYSSPKDFDSTYKNELHKYFGSVVDIDNKGVKRIFQHGAYHSKLSYVNDDIGFLQSLIDIFLTNYGFISYGDDVSGVEAAFSSLLLAKNIGLPKYADNDNWVSYLNKISNRLRKSGLCVLRSIEGYDLIVCSCDKSELLIKQFKIIGWELKKQ